MAHEFIPLTIPCTRIRVAIQYGDHQGLGLVEQFFLRAIALGSSDFDALHSLFGLPRRMLLELSIELLNAGLVVIERATRTLRPSKLVVDAMGDPQLPNTEWEKKFSTVVPQLPTTASILQACGHGSLFLEPYSDRSRGGSRAPADPDLPEPRTISKGDLMTVVACLRSHGEGDLAAVLNVSSRRIVDITITSVEATSVVVQAHCIAPKWGDSGELIEPPRFTIIEPTSIPSYARRAIADGLTSLAERGIGVSANQFFRTIQYSQDSAFAHIEDLTAEPLELLDQLQSDIRSRDQQGVNDEELHQALVATLDEFASAMAVGRKGEISAELVIGAKRHAELAVQALQEARVQVVLGCPWMNQLNDPMYRDAIENAVRRGVDVFLLWGIDRRATYDDFFGASWVNALRRPGSGAALHVPQNSCMFHGKLIVKDADWIVIGSSNFLNVTDSARLEIGIQARPLRSGSIIARVLDGCRALLWDPALRRSLMTDPSLLGRQHETESVAQVIAPQAPDWENPMSVKIWLGEWNSTIARLRGELSSAQIAIPILDGEHRTTLIELIGSAKHRLLIASPTLGHGLLATDPLDFIDACLERGVDVVIAHRDIAQREDAQTQAHMQHLFTMRNKGLRMLQCDIHAKIVVSDDTIVVGSFNYLSFDGHYGRRERTHELGLRTRTQAMADEIWEAIHAASVGAVR